MYVANLLLTDGRVLFLRLYYFVYEVHRLDGVFFSFGYRTSIIS